MKITSLWDKLPQDIEFRIYGHVLAKRLSSHRHDKHMLEMLASEGCILDPRTLFDALRRGNGRPPVTTETKKLKVT